MVRSTWSDEDPRSLLRSRSIGLERPGSPGGNPSLYLGLEARDGGALQPQNGRWAHRLSPDGTLNPRVTTSPSRPSATFSRPPIDRRTAPASPVRITIVFCAFSGTRAFAGSSRSTTRSPSASTRTHTARVVVSSDSNGEGVMGAAAGGCAGADCAARGTESGAGAAAGAGARRVHVHVASAVPARTTSTPPIIAFVLARVCDRENSTAGGD